MSTFDNKDQYVIEGTSTSSVKFKIKLKLVVPIPRSDPELFQPKSEFVCLKGCPFEESDYLQLKSENVTENQKEGYIYVLFNEMYKYYGPNIYKIGESNNCQKRLKGYVTGYIDNPIIVYQSPFLPDSELAESLIFRKLSDYRVRTNREFFRCEIDLIRKTIDEVSELLLSSSDFSQIDKYLGDISKKKIKPCRSAMVDLIVKSPLSTSDQYQNHLKKIHQYHPIDVSEKASMLKYMLSQIYQIDGSQMNSEFIDKYVNDVVISKYINRCKMSSNDLDCQIREIYGFEKNQDSLDYFDEKHEFFDLLLSYMFLCQILKTGHITNENIKKFTITGGELMNRWRPYHASISDKIKTWTYKLRNDNTKLITKEQCLKWTNKGFLQFLNSLIDQKLGLQLVINHRHPRNAMNHIYKLRDNCNFDNPNGPLLREIKILAPMDIPLKNVCLIWNQANTASYKQQESQIY